MLAVLARPLIDLEDYFKKRVTILELTPTWAQASLNQHGSTLPGAASIERVFGPSHGRPQRSEDGRKGGAGRAQAAGRARNGVGSYFPVRKMQERSEYQRSFGPTAIE
jgi:hypothetical protein